VSTVEVFEDNALVSETLKMEGWQQALVVNGRASTRCALLGDRLAQLACDNGWTGIVVHGAYATHLS